VERLLQQIADARHAGDRRDAMSQLSSLLQDNIRVSTAYTLLCLHPAARGVEESNSVIWQTLLREGLQGGCLIPSP